MNGLQRAISKDPEERVVLHVTTVHRVPDPRIFLKECTALANSGYKVIALACDNQGNRDYLNYRIESLGTPSSSMFRRAFCQLRVLRRVLSLAPRFVHFHDPELLPLFLFVALIFRRRMIVIFDIHEDYASPRTNGDFLLGRVIYRYLLRAAESRLHILLAEDSYSTFCTKEHAVIHNYGFECQSIPLRDRERRISYLGNVSTERGAKAMLYAFAKAKLDTFQLAMVGQCDETGLKDGLFAEVSRLALQDRVEIRDYLPMVEAMELIKRSWIGLALLQPIPNYMNSIPTKILDYLSAAVCVVASDFPFYRHIFRGVPGIFFVDPTDENAIAIVLNQLVSNPHTLEKEGEAGRAFVRRHFSWENESKKLVDAYSSFASHLSA